MLTINPPSVKWRLTLWGESAQVHNAHIVFLRACRAVLHKLLATPGALEAITGQATRPGSAPGSAIIPLTLPLVAPTPQHSNVLPSPTNDIFSIACPVSNPVSSKDSNTLASLSPLSPVPAHAHLSDPVTMPPNMAAKSSTVNKKALYHEDLYPSSNRFAEPIKCEVFCPSIQDPLLADEYQRPGLSNIKCVLQINFCCRCLVLTSESFSQARRDCWFQWWTGIKFFQVFRLA